MKKNDLVGRLTVYSASVLRLLTPLPEGIDIKAVRNQLSRSATSVAANYMEAQIASSKADFTNKLHIASKELWETIYWLKMLEMICPEESTIQSRLKTLLDESDELRRILASCILTAKGRKKGKGKE